MSLPTWVPPERQCGKHGREAVAEMVVDCIEAVTCRPVQIHRASTNARPILALWRSLGCPDPAEFVAEVRLVAEWAQTSTDPLAARDIRAEGWEAGLDRSRSVATVCVQQRWDDRLTAAQAWKQAGQDQGTLSDLVRLALARFGARGPTEQGDIAPDPERARAVVVGLLAWSGAREANRGAVRAAFAELARMTTDELDRWAVEFDREHDNRPALRLVSSD